MTAIENFQGETVEKSPITPESNEIEQQALFTKEEILELSTFQREELSEVINLDNQRQVDNFLNSNPKYNESPDYAPVISELLKERLNFEQIILVLDAGWDIVKARSDSEKLFDIVKRLKDEGLLDSAGIEFDENILVEDVIEEVANSGNDKTNESNETGLDKLISVARSQVGIVEGRAANKYGGFDTTRVPWCAAFINWCLKQSGYKGTGSNLALSFVGLSGYGHTGIKSGNKMISGNWGNKVALSNPMSQTAVGYVIPTKNGLKKYPGNIAYKNIPDGAIVCWRRNPRSGRGA